MNSHWWKSSVLQISNVINQDKVLNLSPCSLLICFIFMDIWKFKADNSRGVLSGNEALLTLDILQNCVVFSLRLSNGCKFPHFHGRLMDETAAYTPPKQMHPTSHVTVFILTSNMWWGDYSSSQFSSWSKVRYAKVLAKCFKLRCHSCNKLNTVRTVTVRPEYI